MVSTAVAFPGQPEVVLARFLALMPRVLLLDEPTRGVDMTTKSQIYLLIRQLAAGGTSVLVVSSELIELIGLCDRILVLHEGRVAVGQDPAVAVNQRLHAARFRHQYPAPISG